MSVLAFDKDTGKMHKSGDLQLANAILKAKKKDHPWDVIGLIIKAFKDQDPKRYNSYVIRLKEMSQQEKRTWVGNKEFLGVSKDKETGGHLAHTVDFPVWLMMAIRKVYNTDELIMDKKFFREFGERYPEFRVMRTV